ncbi:uncharacterized protein LOC124316737 [Daphnia pulicaria]|uniref:uncharacterized protein LOC124316737 n=1 Tax=Daphnia pulicaria TaxID=35523 RepID=UPI001EEA0AD3|nr:uncharacterized protein LOC124316737 [Daphnia pulicaria]
MSPLQRASQAGTSTQQSEITTFASGMNFCSLSLLMNVKLCYPEGDPANAAQICLAVCAVSNGGPFSITTPEHRQLAKMFLLRRSPRSFRLRLIPAVSLLCFVGTVHSSSKHFSNHGNDHSGEDRYDGRYGNSYDSCTSPSGEVGICTSGSTCSSLGGIPSGSCRRTTICCVNVTITTWGGTATLNNTYWHSPSTVINTPSICGLTIKPNSMEHDICQIRLDFITFTTAQPTAGTCKICFKLADQLLSFQLFVEIIAANTCTFMSQRQHLPIMISSSF